MSATYLNTEHGSLLHSKPASNWIFHDTYSVQVDDKNTMCYMVGSVIGAAERVLWFVWKQKMAREMFFI
jgi:hypothetical protein